MPGNDALAFTTAVNTLAAAMDALARVRRSRG